MGGISYPNCSWPRVSFSAPQEKGEKVMAKITSITIAGPDDPIYTGRWVVSKQGPLGAIWKMILQI